MPGGECGRAVNAEETQAVGGERKTQRAASGAQRAWTIEGSWGSREVGEAFPPIFMVCFLVGKVGRQCFLRFTS